jgi:amidase
VARLRAAGAVLIGRTNMADLAMGFHTTSRLYGDTRNPWAADRTPGGTSGGDGAAVATGMTALGLGNDSGGSVRIPAAFCGVAGLKPGYGRFPADHRIGGREPTLASQLFPVDGPLARSVADLRLAYSVLAGPDPIDPRVPPVPAFGPALPGPIRVGVVVDPGERGVHPDVRAAVERAAAVLEAAGYLTEEIELPQLDECLATYGRMIMTEFGLGWELIRPLLSEAGQTWIEQSMAQQPPASLPDYIQTAATRLSLQRDWFELMARYPVIIGPVFMEPPVLTNLATETGAGTAIVQQAMRLVTATTFVGLPAVAVPAGLAAELPMSVQVIGQPFREDVCLDVAAVLEAAFGRLTPIDPRI